jgi:acyl-CoA synthetase (NDP forming)
MLENVMNAASVAIVGASRNETKRGYQAIRTLREEGYEGEIYPVNPRETVVLGLKCYPSVAAIEGTVDLALVATPAASLPAILEDCGQKGVQGAVVLAGGFGETGPEGKALENEMVAIARRHGIRLVGPNTSGMMNVPIGLNLVGMRDVPKGDIALLSQSGNMALTLITEARLKSKKGFSCYVGVGNEADIKFHEYLEFFRRDPRTRVILMYVEGMREGRRFLEQAYKTTVEKPVVLLKSGRSSTGRRSAGSHTGALAGMSEVATGAFNRAGIITIEKSDQLFPAAEALSNLPPIRNNRVAILADGGGHATIAADLLTDLGVEIPPLEEKTRAALRELLPAAASVPNPVDVAGGTDADPSIFADCARVLLKDANVGGLLIVGLFGGYGIRFAQSLCLMEEDAAHRMGKMVRKHHKPIVVHSLYSSAGPHSLDLLRYYRIPVYDSLDVATKCMGVLSEYGRYLGSYHAKFSFTIQRGKKARPDVQKLLDAARREEREALLENEARRLLAAHGVMVARHLLARSVEEAVAAARAIEGPVAMKIVSPDILHKSDAGGVMLDLAGDASVAAAFGRIMENASRFDAAADIRGVLVTPMLREGLEIIVGTKIDDQFGPVIMFGIGGVLVEVLKDVVFRVLPISRRSARQMVAEIRSARLLEGFRGNPPRDRRAIVNLLLTVSEIVEAYPWIRELDLNPVLVYEEGVSIADARILLLPEKASREKGHRQR